jgi:hypothetical protein
VVTPGTPSRSRTVRHCLPKLFLGRYANDVIAVIDGVSGPVVLVGTAWAP